MAAQTDTKVNLQIERTAAMEPLGWHSGDPHLHIPRQSARDDEVVLDLLEAEDIRYGSILGYNEPAGPYSGFMEKLASPQQRGLGKKSARDRDGYHAFSGQEYRNTTYGHILLFNRDDLVFKGQDLNADNWPVYGLVARETMDQGGYAAYAHGGYRQEVYADVALGALNAIELLQFGIYREIGLTDWYHMLNAGYRIPCVGASDWPACRWMGDCRTYVYHEGATDFPQWLQAMAEGRSFMTTGPLLLLAVDGHRPGDTIALEGAGPHTVKVEIQLNCEVTSVDEIDIIVGGEVVKKIHFSSKDGFEPGWRKFEETLELPRSTWIAARAFSKTPGGQPDAEAHTNPVYVDLDGRRVYQPDSLDTWVERIDGQTAKHRQRNFPEKARVLDYFQKARDLLLEIRAEKGLKSNDDPAKRSAPVFEAARVSGLEVDAAEAFPSEEALREFLKPVAPKTPTEALATFETLPGFEMQLVAAEPLVYDPVAAAFDEDGNLYVCEMRDYPFKPG
ncbi:MAG: CehA/McbA family metallohydrolase, partial [Planctomycetota bacterium]|nr:CehA/McbA family metallohydrolase [Planctomycetota bacterium]